MIHYRFCCLGLFLDSVYEIIVIFNAVIICLCTRLAFFVYSTVYCQVAHRNLVNGYWHRQRMGVGVGRGGGLCRSSF